MSSAWLDKGDYLHCCELGPTVVVWVCVFCLNVHVNLLWITADPCVPYASVFACTSCVTAFQPMDFRQVAPLPPPPPPDLQAHSWALSLSAPVSLLPPEVFMDRLSLSWLPVTNAES